VRNAQVVPQAVAVRPRVQNFVDQGPGLASGPARSFQVADADLGDLRAGGDVDDARSDAFSDESFQRRDRPL